VCGVEVAVVGALPEAGTNAPWLSIMLAEIDVMPPLPVFDAKETSAISPLPEKPFVLMMAILMRPGVAVFATNNAPATSAPWVTVGVANEEAS